MIEPDPRIISTDSDGVSLCQTTHTCGHTVVTPGFILLGDEQRVLDGAEALKCPECMKLELPPIERDQWE